MPDAPNPINRWMGGAIGLVRASLGASLVVYILAVAPVDYLRDSARHAFVSPKLIQVAPVFYQGMWHGVMRRFMISERSNTQVPITEHTVNSRL